jgi:hypothetical protein
MNLGQVRNGTRPETLNIFSFCYVQQKNPDSKKGPVHRLASLNCSAYADGTQIM